MKNTHFIYVFLLFIIIFSSCSTDVNLYADYKDVAIVYAMLDHGADTNFVKIIRAYCGTNDNPIDATEVALIADSSNYPGKLDARIIELKNSHGGPYEPTGRVIQLDTITIHDKEEGTFYAPDQKLYYTTEPLLAGSAGSKYKYRLVVVKPNGDTLSAQTNLVGNEEFVIVTGSVGFQQQTSDGVLSIIFRADGMASFYEIEMQFNYREQLAGQEMKRKCVRRNFGAKMLNEYKFVEQSENAYYQEYGVNWLFHALKDAIGADTIVNPNHPNVVRYIDDFVITISAAGDELALYYTAHQAQMNSVAPVVIPFTNIDGGFGLFSSRTTITKVARLSSGTKRDLFAHTSWGFIEE